MYHSARSSKERREPSTPRTRTQPSRSLRTQFRTIPGARITWINNHRRIITDSVNTSRSLSMSKPSKNGAVTLVISYVSRRRTVLPEGNISDLLNRTVKQWHRYHVSQSFFHFAPTLFPDKSASISEIEEAHLKYLLFFPHDKHIISCRAAADVQHHAILNTFDLITTSCSSHLPIEIQ